MAIDFEKTLIKKSIDQMKKLIEEKHDMESALIIMELCKYIAGDKFEVKLERKGTEDNGN